MRRRAACRRGVPLVEGDWHPHLVRPLAPETWIVARCHRDKIGCPVFLVPGRQFLPLFAR